MAGRTCPECGEKHHDRLMHTRCRACDYPLTEKELLRDIRAELKELNDDG